MNKKEYLEKKKALDERYNKEKKELDMEYVRENNPVKFGDVVTDHYKTIRVEKTILSYDFHAIPCASYRGIRLTRAGVPAKVNADDNLVFISNIKEINGKPYKYEV